MRALITGSAGFVGPYLTRLLRADGHTVAGFDLADGDDVRDYEQVLAAVRRTEPDWVFHLAAVSWPRESLSDPRRCLDVNITGALNVLEAVRATGCGARVLLAGTSEEYGYDTDRPELTEESACYPVTPYGASKLAQTSLGMTYARCFGVPVVATRAFNHTGYGRQACNAESAFARRIVAVERGHADAVEHGDLSSYRNFTNVRDVVRAYRTVIELEPGIYNVCSTDTVSMEMVMKLLISAAGHKTGDFPMQQIPGLGTPSTTRFPVPHCRLLTEAGWKPSVSLEETMAELIDYWRKR